MAPCKTAQEVSDEMYRAAKKRLVVMVEELAGRLMLAKSKAHGVRPPIKIDHDIFLLARMVAGNMAFNMCESLLDLQMLIYIVVLDYNADVAEHILDMKMESFFRYCRDHHILLPEDVPGDTFFKYVILSELIHLNDDLPEIRQEFVCRKVETFGDFFDFFSSLDK